MNELEEIQKSWPGKLGAYVVGLVLSLLFTLTSFWLVANRIIEGPHLTYTLMGVALAQAAAQLLFFLHLSHEGRPRWNLYIFITMMSFAAILVAGSIWIMVSLNDRTMPSQEEMNHYMQELNKK